MAPDATIPRLARLLRMVLGATTPGEQMAALAAFNRATAAAGLDLHDIVGRFEAGAAGAQPQPRDTPSADREPARDPRVAAWEDMLRPDLWDDPTGGARVDMDHAEAIAATLPDEVWPHLARWLTIEDDAWHAAHTAWLLNGTQRGFVGDMAAAAGTVRPTLRQSAWLLALFAKVARQKSRPPAPPAPPKLGAPPAAERTYRTRELPPPRRRRQPERIIGRKDQVGWICAVIAARRLGPRPIEDTDEPALFSDAEVRALAWLAAAFGGWRIDRPAKAPLAVDRPRSGAEIAAASHVSLRTVRRALAKATRAEYLTVERSGVGRGCRTVYRLTFPSSPRLRHAAIPAAAPRRQAARTAKG
jgi:hypothetical protein